MNAQPRIELLDYLRRIVHESAAYPCRAETLALLDSLRSSAGASVDQWRCFHCEEVFTDRARAALHFGRNEFCDPACHIDIEKYRAMEEVHRRHCEEDTDLHRAIHRAQSDGDTKARRAEEEGYARGLKDAGFSGEPSALLTAVKALLSSECSVPEPYTGNFRDPVNDLRIVSGRHMNALRKAVDSSGEPEGWYLKQDQTDFVRGVVNTSILAGLTKDQFLWAAEIAFRALDKRLSETKSDKP